MPKWFNTAGPCRADLHYMLPPLARLPNLTRLVAQQGYFVIHAPRQTGKTTAMLALAQQLTASGDYTAVMVSAEVGAPFPHDPGLAERAMLSDWWEAASVWLPAELQPPPWTSAEPGRHIGQALNAWAKASPRPLVIKVQSLTLRNFTPDEVAQLYQQHAAETGQVFTLEAVQKAFVLTQGQPWLVNALAKEAVEELVPDPAWPITLNHIEQAKENLIQRQDTHLDSLTSLLQEDRVRAIIEPILSGQELGDIPQDDIQFLIDLGLCRISPQGGLVVGNPIYQEILPRVIRE